MRFRDRTQGGRRLGLRLVRYRDDDVVVVGLAGGGVPVAYEVAKMLDAPLDVLVVRKVPAPGLPGLALGALAEDGCTYFNFHIIERSGIRAHELERLIGKETAELERRVALYREAKPAVSLAGRTVIVVDDGLSTGATARAAVDTVRKREAARIVLASPVASRDLVAALRDLVYDIVCVETPPFVSSIAEWYADVPEVRDEDNVVLLERATGDRLAKARAMAGA